MTIPPVNTPHMTIPPVTATPSTAPSTAPRANAEVKPSGAQRKWYSHGWNRPLAWEMLLGITPRLPRFLLGPMHHLVAAMCFWSMKRERAAVRRNLRRVTGLTGRANFRLAYRLWHNFGRFLLAYIELRHLDVARFRDRISGVKQVETTLQQAIDARQGAIILTMHIGQWDLGLKMMSLHDVPVHVVMLSEDPVEVSRYTDEARATPNLRVHQTGSTPLLAVELMAALKRGEFVAIQGDRPAGSQVMDVEFFGAPTSLPTGPAQLAMATGAPIIPIFVLFDQEDRFRLEMMPPMRFASVPREQRRAGDDAPVREAMRRIAVMMESVVRRYPDQWFNFYDVWPARPGENDA